MGHSLKPDGLDDMDELRQAFTKRVIPPALEERLLSSEKLRQDLLQVATQDEVHLFIRKAQMSSQLRSQLFVESPVILTNKTTSTLTPTASRDGKHKSPQSSGQCHLTGLPGSTVASKGSKTTTTPMQIADKRKAPSLLVKDELPTKSLTSIAPAKRVFTAKRTLPPHLISKPNPTQKSSEPFGNKPVISASPISPEPTRIVSDILQTLEGNHLLSDASKQGEDAKEPPIIKSQLRPPLAAPQTIPQLGNGHPHGPGISDEQEKGLKRKRDDSPPPGASRDSHIQKSRKANPTNTPSETIDAASSKTYSEKELVPANHERSILKGSQKRRSKDVVRLGESSLSNDTDVVSSVNHNHLARHRRPLIDEDRNETDDDIPLRKLINPAKATKTGWDYHIWTFPSGETQVTSGALLPRGYALHDNPDAPWICPIRSCRVLFSKLEGLGAHFNRGHRASLLNDNGDGTLSIIRKLKAVGVAMPAEVVSHKPLDPTEPLKEPSLNSYLKLSKSVTPSSSQSDDNRDGLTKARRSSRTLSTFSMLGTEAPTREDSPRINSRKKNSQPEVGLEQLEKPATRTFPKEKSVTPRGSPRSDSPRQPNIVANAQNGDHTASRAHTSTMNPAQALELETWEIAPGRIRDEQSEAVDNFAFSNSYLTQNQAVRIGRDISFQVITIKPGTVHFWGSSANKLRLCSVASGKLQISIHGQDFSMGPNGMIRIRPGAECTATNRLYTDATVHVTIVPGDLCG
ncbi:hypothetical protein F4813DRAFT_377461 [Daldinia decipiens]|uniref:uncharacterized protein n=1 Tax=Daldinia decipiens TaxID=326647 RepID=UPI0020C2E451|nr:uncharacterized protein F4813DRAFT_377461 [Daldinia decipiens]KAI1652632.1 hypothetical protein F4813DRAFT_377461 [Daldinia decipiens]